MDMDKLRDSVNIAAVIGSRIPLTQRGHEYVALCPFHDEQSPSFYVLPQKQFFHCFGCSVSGDVVAFLQQFDGISFLEACEVLSHQPASPLPMRPGLKASSKEQDWISEVPPDTDPRPVSMTTRNHGEVTASWCYKTLEGAVWGYAARYEIVRDGVTKKAVLQWTYGKSADETTARWACKHFSRLRPLYGLEHLYQPDKQVLIVEGEKTVEAARVLFPTMVVVTWPGGASAAKYADWAPLTERECVMLPDADPEGKAAGLWICDHLDTLGCSVRMITPEPSRAKGWDMADALADQWGPTEAVRWAKANITEHVPTTTPANAPAEVIATPPSPFSEDALAQRFAELHHENMRYVKVWGSWIIWRDHRWAKDERDEVHEAVRTLLCEAVNWEAGVLMPESGRRKINTLHMVRAVGCFAGFNPAIAATVDQWDADPWLLATPAGTIDLRTGGLRLSRREDYQLQCTTVAPSDGACPVWNKFLDEVTGHDGELITYLQRLMGYSLTGLTVEQTLAFFYGTGGNGKGVFLSTVRAILGNYATVAPMATFTESKTERHPTDVAGLQGVRLVMAQETEEGRRWAESLIKSMTGGDPIKARFMRQDYFEFIPKFKLVFAGNHKPALRSVDEAMRRRMHIVPWTVTIAAEQRDPLLCEKLKVEYPAILQWMIDGCLAWQQRGLAAPAQVIAATEDYMQAEDALAEWLEQQCILAPEQSVSSQDIYQNYVTWCEQTHEFSWSHKRLVSNLTTRGITLCKLGKIRSLIGIGLKLPVPSSTVPTW